MEPEDGTGGGGPTPALRLLGDKQAVKILFEEVAPRLADRHGGYTRMMRLAKPRLGDAGTRAILELVGKNDRVRRKAARPAFETDETEVQPVAPAAENAEPPNERNDRFLPRIHADVYPVKTPGLESDGFRPAATVLSPRSAANRLRLHSSYPSVLRRHGREARSASAR